MTFRCERGHTPVGKRQRRRDRQQSGSKRSGAVARPAPRVVFPNAAQPLLEVHIEPGTANEVRTMGIAYWEFSEPGTWSRNVSPLGIAHQILKAIRGQVHASLLTLECPRCATPVTVATRSEMAATGVWSVDAFPREPAKSAAPCQDCRAAAAAARAVEAKRLQEQRKQEQERRVATAGQWVAAHEQMPEAEENPEQQAALVLLAVTEILKRTGKDSIGPLNGLPYTMTGSASDDLKVFRELYQKRYLAPTLPATVGNFAFDEDDKVTGVYVDQVPWRLAHWMGNDLQDAINQATFTAFLVLEPADVQRLLTDVEATMTVDYLEGLLTRDYDETPIPEHRLPDAYAIAHGALEGGFTLGQMLAVAWSAAAGAVSWGQRTRGLKPGNVSAAAVTTLERRAETAKDRPVLEYNVPKWLALSAVRATARRFLEDYQRGEAADAAYQEFTRILQRVNSRPTRWDQDDEPAIRPAGQTERPFAVVTPAGELESGRPGTLPGYALSPASRTALPSMC
jgi:hypothetical protein